MSESEKVVVTKLKLDTLANAINAKADSSGAKTIDELVETVNGIRVKDIWLNSTSIKTPPTKTIYNPGEPIDTTGMVITLGYSNGATKDITSGFTISPETAIVGHPSVTIEYRESGVVSYMTQHIVVNSPIMIGKNYVSNLNVADTTVRGIAFADNSYLMIGTDARYNMYRMWMTQNTSGESHRVQANATGTYPAADLACSNDGFIAVPMTTTYGGTLYKNRYLASWDSVDEFRNSAAKVSFKVQTQASVKTANRAVTGNNGYVFIGGQYGDHGFFGTDRRSFGVSLRHYFAWTTVIDLAYGDDILFVIANDNRIHWVPSPITHDISYNGPIVDGTVVKCAALGRNIAVIARKTDGYVLYVYRANDDNTMTLTHGNRISSNASDQIVGVNRIGDYLAVIGIDGENNGFIFVVNSNNAYLGQKYMLGLKPLLTCQSGNGIGVLNNAGGKYAIAQLSI